MANISQKKQSNGNSGRNTMTAAVAGAVIGAGIAIAGAAALKDENRQKVKDVLNDVKDQAGNYIEEQYKKAKKGKEELEEMAEVAAETAKDSLSSSKKKKA